MPRMEESPESETILAPSAPRIVRFWSLESWSSLPSSPSIQEADFVLMP